MRKIKQLWYKLNGRLDPYETDVQKIFYKVIEGGHYTSRCDLMCISLIAAGYCDVINKEQKEIARQSIKEYLGFYGTLSAALIDSNLDSSFQHRLAIYKDWANRPKLEVK